MYIFNKGTYILKNCIYKLETLDSLAVNNEKNEIGEECSNSTWGYLGFLCINFHQKGMNQYLLIGQIRYYSVILAPHTPAMGK